MRILVSSTLLVGLAVTLTACESSSGQPPWWSGQSDTDDIDTGNEGEGNDSATGDGDGDGEADGKSSLSCDLLIQCVKAVTPEATSGTIATYGPAGTCFDIPGITPEDCWAECHALWESLSAAHPDAPECAPPGCNNGTLEPNEQCDSTSGCSATCKLTSPDLECNAVNDAGCSDGEKCLPRFGATQCGPMGSDPLGRGESNCWGKICGDGLLCGPCEGPQNYCCAPACYLGPTNEPYGQCPGGLTCVSVPELFGGSWPSGSGLMGICM